MACGWEQPVTDGRAWCHDGYDVGEFTDEHPRGIMYPRICPGYTTRLAPVLEVTWDRIHWSKGTLVIKLKGQPLDLELRMLEQLEIQSRVAEAWLIKNPKKS